MSENERPVTATEHVNLFREVMKKKLRDPADDDVIQKYVKQVMDNMWRQLQQQYWAAYTPISELQDPNSWTLPDTALWEPEAEYVEDFCGYKLYRRVWPDGREEWTYNYGEPLYVAPPRDRLELRRAILRNRNMPVRRAADGGLVGWRYWLLGFPTEKMSDAILVSPHRRTQWLGPTLTAEAWSDGSACEGVAGIHASLRPQPAVPTGGSVAMRNASSPAASEATADTSSAPEAGGLNASSSIICAFRLTCTTRSRDR